MTGLCTDVKGLARSVSLATSPESYRLQRSLGLSGLTPRIAGSSSLPLRDSELSSVSGSRKLRVTEPRAEEPRSSGARARSASPARPGRERAQGVGRSHRLRWPGAPSEPLRAPGGGHPGAPQLIPGARPPRGDSRTGCSGRRRQVSSKPADRSAPDAAPTRSGADSARALLESEPGPRTVLRTPRASADLVAGAGTAESSAR